MSANYSQRTSAVGSRSFTLILAALTGLTSLSIDMNLPALPQLAKTLHVSVGAVQLTLSLFLLGFAIGQLICGPISDRVGRRPVLLGGLLVFALAGFLCAASSSLFLLVSARFLQGLGASVGPVLARAMVRDCFEPKAASATLSQMTQIMIISPLLAPMIGGYLLVSLGWPAIFLFLGASGLLIWTLCWRFLPETLPQTAVEAAPTHPIWHDFGCVLSHRATVRYLLASCFAYAGMFAYVSLSPFVAIQIFHISRQNFGYVFALTALALMLGATLNRKLLGRYAPTTLLNGGMFGVVAGGVLMVVCSWFGLGGLAGIVVPMMIFMVGQGLVQPNAMASAMAPHGKLAGLASSLMGCLQTAGGALAGYVVGALYNGTTLPMAATIAGLAVAAFALLDRRPASLPVVEADETIGEIALLESGA